MARIELRDNLNRLIGWRESSGDRIVAKDNLGRLKGWYEPRFDQTKDACGRMIGRGDMLAALIVAR